MPDASLHVAHLRVEMLATDRTDARDILQEVTDRLFGEECVITIVVPDPESIVTVKPPKWTPSGTFDTGSQPPRQRWDHPLLESEWTADPDGPSAT